MSSKSVAVFPCESNSTVTSKRLRCVAVLVVGAAALAPRVVSAQQWVCYTIAAGETAAGAALRIAGNANARHHERFQIFDPSVSKFVAKSRYDRIRPGWVACTLGQSAPVHLGVAPTATAGQRPHPFLIVPILLLAMSFGLYEFDRRWRLRREAIIDMTQFGQSVIREFERPLVQSRDPRPALKSQLRFKPYRSRLEVLLAPAVGRSYPNLSDHRKNVEYDIERVRHALGDTPFVNDSIRQRGEWVVLSFRKAGAL